MTEHKNAKWVKMYVEGKPVQWKMAGIDGAYHDWQLVTSLQQFDDQGLMFRATPNKVTTKGYKRYAWQQNNLEWAVGMIHEGDKEDYSNRIYIDKEWQYHVIEDVV